MLAQFLMHLMNFDAVWYAHPGPLRRVFKHHSPLKAIWKIWTVWMPRWHVGVWTGPQCDLVCVKDCRTNKEGDKWLSPGARTILGATISAARLRWRLSKEEKDA